MCNNSPKRSKLPGALKCLSFIKINQFEQTNGQQPFQPCSELTGIFPWTCAVLCRLFPWAGRSSVSSLACDVPLVSDCAAHPGEIYSLASSELRALMAWERLGKWNIPFFQRTFSTENMGLIEHATTGKLLSAPGCLH